MQPNGKKCCRRIEWHIFCAYFFFVLFCFILRLATTHFLNGKELLTTNTASGIPAYVFSLAGNGGNSIVSVVAIVRSASKQFGLVDVQINLMLGYSVDVAKKHTQPMQWTAIEREIWDTKLGTNVIWQVKQRLSGFCIEKQWKQERNTQIVEGHTMRHLLTRFFTVYVMQSSAAIARVLKM